jgi:FkbM family methyltransferase
MPSPRRLAKALLDRRLPLGARLGLLAADLRVLRTSRSVFVVPYGLGRVYLTKADFAIDRASFVFAVSEATYATDYHEAVVLDIGAHKGYYAAYAVTKGARTVVTYEPESANLAILERTAAGYRARGGRWEVRRAAVDARAGRAELHVMPDSWAHALELPKSFAEHRVATQSVPVVALATAIGDAAALAPGRRLVVKMNIEGAECSAILGTAAEAWQPVSELFVETHPWATCDADDLAAHLGEVGFIRLESRHPAVLRMGREALPRSGRHSVTT